ncbi:DUF4229 domain-containing protein [Plantactinospora sp. KBS50]|uniref:DUF4229 domain-containing protein n=1 Tax=Plantactinospora sp. KBS50 TaxID=2024580 RepID=UPI000BAA9C7D|nr:DUF4229 domain-containing protein [Plantactinospora sp. KBS50]ASW53197.1 hypothetical protein CIK06_01895 [Plantactinospora sp. KBS50]
MSPAVKYTLGRIGLFVVVLAALLPVHLNVFIKLMLALAFSAALSFFFLRSWRDSMAQQLSDAAQRRQSEKDRLRAALAGEDDEDEEPAPAEGGPGTVDRPAAPDAEGRGGG